MYHCRYCQRKVESVVECFEVRVGQLKWVNKFETPLETLLEALHVGISAQDRPFSQQ